MKEQIYKQDAVDALNNAFDRETLLTGFARSVAVRAVKGVPSIPQEPISDAYARAVLTWLTDYQIRAAELQGRYTPYEVLSWVVNDWRKENEGTGQ